MNATLKTKLTNFYTANKAAVDSLAAYLGVPPMWLVAVWDNESGLNPKAGPNSIGAVGLNQMLPSTLAGLNSSASAYHDGSVNYQIQIMKDFYKPIKGKIKRAGDLYLFNFLPAAVIENVSAGFVLGASGDTSKYHGMSKDLIYNQNKSLDYNHDGQITRQDFWDGFEGKYDELVNGSFFFRDLGIDLKTNWWIWLSALVLLLLMVFVILKFK